MGKEVSDVSGSGEQDLGGFLHAAVSGVEMDHFWRMADGYTALVKVFVLADNRVAVGGGKVPDVGIFLLLHPEIKDMFCIWKLVGEYSDQLAG